MTPVIFSGWRASNTIIGNTHTTMCVCCQLKFRQPVTQKHYKPHLRVCRGGKSFHDLRLCMSSVKICCASHWPSATCSALRMMACVWRHGRQPQWERWHSRGPSLLLTRCAAGPPRILCGLPVPPPTLGHPQTPGIVEQHKVMISNIKVKGNIAWHPWEGKDKGIHKSILEYNNMHNISPQTQLSLHCC